MAIGRQRARCNVELSHATRAVVHREMTRQLVEVRLPSFSRLLVDERESGFADVHAVKHTALYVERRVQAKSIDDLVCARSIGRELRIGAQPPAHVLGLAESLQQ